MLLPYTVETGGGLKVLSSLFEIRMLDRAHFVEACERITFSELDGTTTPDDLVIADGLDDRVEEYYRRIKAFQLQLRARRLSRAQIHFHDPDTTNALPGKMLLSVLLALAAVCADWEVECNSPEDQRPPFVCVRLAPFHETEVGTLMTILTTGSETTNVQQVLGLVDLYQGQVVAAAAP